MFSPLFTKIATSPAKELRIIMVQPEGYVPLPEPFDNLTLRQTVDAQASPFQIAQHYRPDPKQHSVFPVWRPFPQFKLDWADIEPAEIVKSIEEAEAAVLNLNYLDSMFQTYSNGQGSCCGDNPSLGILINRASNLIAAQTRRGGGNLVFMHPDNLTILKSEFSSALGLVENEKIGLWLKAGYLNSSMAVYTNPDFTKDRVIVVYSGSLGDGPAQLVNRGAQTYLAIHKDAARYMKAILIEK